MPQKLNMWMEQVNNGLKSVTKGAAELGVHLHSFFFQFFVIKLINVALKSSIFVTADPC